MAETVTVSCWMPTCVDQAWDVWTTASGLHLWWWPHLIDATFEVDPRIGGGFYIHAPSVGVTVRGTYLGVDRPQDLAMEWRWDGRHSHQGESDLVQVRLDGHEGGTAVTVAQTRRGVSGWPDFESTWIHALDRLANLR